MIQIGDTGASDSEFFFRVTDRLQMDSCVTAVAKEGKSLLLYSESRELLDHYGAAIVRRLKQDLPETDIEVFMPIDTEGMLERFNQLLGTLSLDIATKSRAGKAPENVWVVHEANALGAYELELLTRLVHQFPGAGIAAVIMFASDTNPSSEICGQGKQFISWTLELPTPEQKLSAIQQARKNGEEEAAVQFFNRLTRSAPKKTSKDSKSKDAKPPAAQSSPASTASDRASEPRKIWPWVATISGLLALSVSVAAFLNPEVASRLMSDAISLFEAEPAPMATEKTTPEKPEAHTLSASPVKDDPPAAANAAESSPLSPSAVAPEVLAAPKELPAPAPIKPEKLITELPDIAIQGRAWLKGLPQESFCLEHGIYATVKQARASMKDKPWLVNARVLPVFAQGQEEAQFSVVTGHFRSKDRARNTITRMGLSADVKIKSHAALMAQASPEKTKP